MVIHHLIDQLSNKNQDDIHMTLNASNVLREFSDNENLFQLLIQHEEFKKLVSVCGQFDSNRQNLPYAHHMLNNVLAQF